jgi:hypothetical protein
MVRRSRSEAPETYEIPFGRWAVPVSYPTNLARREWRPPRTRHSEGLPTSLSQTPACYRQGVQGVSKRSYVFLIALRFSLFACGQNFESPNLYSTWKIAFPLSMKYVV